MLWNLGLIFQWGTHLIPARGPISFREAAYNQFAVVPRTGRAELEKLFHAAPPDDESDRAGRREPAETSSRKREASSDLRGARPDRIGDSGNAAAAAHHSARRWWVLPFGELWHSRELLYFFVWRDIKIRYKQTAIGAAWAVLQPLLAMLVFTLFFGRLAHIPSDGLPYRVFLRRLAALDVFRGVAAERDQHDRRKSAH